MIVSANTTDGACPTPQTGSPLAAFGRQPRRLALSRHHHGHRDHQASQLAASPHPLRSCGCTLPSFSTSLPLWRLVHCKVHQVHRARLQQEEAEQRADQHRAAGNDRHLRGGAMGGCARGCVGCGSRPPPPLVWCGAAAGWLADDNDAGTQHLHPTLLVYALVLFLPCHCCCCSSKVTRRYRVTCTAVVRLPRTTAPLQLTRLKVKSVCTATCHKRSSSPVLTLSSKKTCAQERADGQQGPASLLWRLSVCCEPARRL